MDPNGDKALFNRVIRHASWRLRKARLYLSLYRQGRRASRMHREKLANMGTPNPIRVLFLASNLASWKVGPIVTRMQHSAEFRPLVAICPVTSGVLAKTPGHTAALLKAYLDRFEFPAIDLSRMGPDDAAAELTEFDPHVVFFTNPHSLTYRQLHEDVFRSRLSCYVPYSHEVMAYGDHREQHNQLSHNCFWRIFVPHEASRSLYARHRVRRDRGVLVSGFPACEPFLSNTSGSRADPWKTLPGRMRRVVYAPHWVWRPDLKMATVHEYGDAMMDIAMKYRDRVQWSFRPHPMLRETLNQHPLWGAARTSKFFQFWEESPFSQMHEADYVDVFMTSDAIVHDSGSFLAEYLYLDKPALYLVTDDTDGKFFNEFGQRAFDACDVGRCRVDIERFLDRVCEGETFSPKRRTFFDQEIAPFVKQSPSEFVCNELLRELAGVGRF